MLQTNKVCSSAKYLNILEIMAIVATLGGSIASIVSQQLLIFSLSVPLSLSVAFVNRNLSARKYNYQTNLLAQENSERQIALDSLSEKLLRLEQLTVQLQEQEFNLNQSHQILIDKEKQLEEVVKELYESERRDAYSTKLERKRLGEIQPNSAEFYCKQALDLEEAGDKQEAINAYTQAIQLNPKYPKAYYQRALLLAELEDKQAAVNDLRVAAKLYFEQSNFTGYQQAKDLSKELYQLVRPNNNDAQDNVLLTGLFL
jgi:tetratricopeptide (TPR) repeat protein